MLDPIGVIHGRFQMLHHGHMEYLLAGKKRCQRLIIGISNPDDVVFMGWFSGGEVFRSGCTFRRGAGKIFYFQPGHETCPIYHHPQIQQILRNAVHWAAPADGVGSEPTCPCAIPSPEAVRKHKDA